MLNQKGKFGNHGGQYIPETLMHAVLELEKAYLHYKEDPEFQKELEILYHENNCRDRCRAAWSGIRDSRSFNGYGM